MKQNLFLFFFHMHFFLQWLSAFLFLLGQCDPASVVLLSLNFSISESGKSFWLIPQQSQTQSSHLMWAKELSCTQIWCNTRSFLPPIPGSRSSQQHVGFSITKLWGGYGVRVTSAEPVCKWCNQKHLIEEKKKFFKAESNLTPASNLLCRVDFLDCDHVVHMRGSAVWSPFGWMCKYTGEPWPFSRLYWN